MLNKEQRQIIYGSSVFEIIDAMIEEKKINEFNLTSIKEYLAQKFGKVCLVYKDTPLFPMEPENHP